MQKKIKFLLVACVVCVTAQSQNPNSLFKIDSNFLSKESFSIFANRTFGQLATGNNTAALANFGSFEILSGAVNFNAFTPLSFKKSESKGGIPYLSLELKGDLASDNTTILFSNSKLNTNIDGSLKLHYPITYFNKIGYLTSEKKKLFANKVSLQQDYDLKLQILDTTGTRDRVKRSNLAWQLNSKLHLAQLKRDTLTLLRDSLNYLMDLVPPDSVRIAKMYAFYISTDDQLTGLEKDSLQYTKEITAIDKIIALAGINRINYVRKLKGDLKKEFKDTLQTMELKASLTSVRLVWVTGKIAFSKKKYYDYDTMKVFAERIEKHTPSYFSGGFELNYYMQYSISQIGHYLNIGILWRGDNNINDLSTSALTQKTKTALNGVEREVLKTYSVYTDSVIGFKSTFFYLNYYFMFNRSALSAVHFFPEYDRRNNGKKYWNLGIGYIISLKDSKKEKSVLNAEAYYKLLDLRNVDEANKKFPERNEIGIRIGLPLNFVLPKAK